MQRFIELTRIENNTSAYEGKNRHRIFVGVDHIVCLSPVDDPLYWGPHSTNVQLVNDRLIVVETVEEIKTKIIHVQGRFNA